jgi:NitT/TauT family transport system substrate-binding protein
MSSTTSPQSRRKFLLLASAGVASAVLAACGGSAAAPSSAAPAVPSLAPAAASTKPAASAGASAKPAASGAASAKPAGSAAASGKPAASPAASGKPAASANGNLPTLKVAYPTTGGTHAPLWVAESAGAFPENGVNVQSQFIAGDIATKAMLGKDVDVVLQSGASVITADVNGNADIVYVGSVLNHSQFSLMTAPSIKTAEDLKGKTVATDKPGTTGDYQTRLILTLLKLTEKDVQLRVLGGSNIVFPALLTNQIDAAAVIPPFSFQAQDKGYNELVNTYKVAYQNVGVTVPKSRLDELATPLKAFLRGYQKGVQLFFQQPDLAKKILTDKADVKDATELQRTYDFYTKTAPFQLDLQPTLEGIQAMLDFLGSTVVPAAKNAKPEQFVDTRFLADLPKLTV